MYCCVYAGSKINLFKSRHTSLPVSLEGFISPPTSNSVGTYIFVTAILRQRAQECGSRETWLVRSSILSLLISNFLRSRLGNAGFPREAEII